MRLLLIRHAQTTSNVLGLLDSRTPGSDLTDLGRAQAAAIPSAIRESPVSSITGSTMTRTVQTAQPLANARGLSIAVEAGIREIEAGEMEMDSGAEPLARYMKAAWAWAARDLDPRMPGAENGYEFFARFDDVVDRVMARGDELPLIFSHGASIRCWVGNRCDNVGDSFAPDAELHNTGSALVERSATGRWELVEWQSAPLGGAALHGKSGPDDDGPTGSVLEPDNPVTTDTTP
jgi:broad specificity phosphatase PhoE